MMKNKTGLVALIVLAVATLLMVFFVLPNISKDKPAETPVAAGSDATTEAAGETKTADGKQARSTESQPAGEQAAAETAGEGTQPAAETPTAEATTAEATTAETATAETAATETATADPTAEWVVPAFDLLRVEPDGSTVIAGRGEPNTTLEIKNGETVVATADIGPSGDFAAVFDKPLDAGDYQLTLNIKDDKGGSKTSEEVATISVPKDNGGELLAMVSKPGEASRLITLPEAKPDETADAASKALETAAAAADDSAGAATTAESAATAGTPADATADTADTAAQADADAAKTVAEPAGEQVALQDTTATETSGAAGDLPAGGATDAGAKPPVRVSAVELEGDRMFIAGAAKPGALVRIYANDLLVGEAKADEAGRYVADGTIKLPVGRHTIRADVMSPDGAKVELRASVPFDRPEGEQVAVVAQDDAAGETAPALGLVGGGTFDKLRAEANKAVTLLTGLYADGRLPSVEQLAAARSATEFALKSLADFKPAADEGEVARDMAAKASAAAAAALARLKALPQDVASVGAAVGSIEAAVATALAPAMEVATETAQAAASSVLDASSETVEAMAERAGDLQRQFTSLFVDGRNASTAEIQTARSALEDVLKRISGFAPATDAGADTLAAIVRLKGWAQTALDRFAAVPAGAGKEAYQQALAAIEGMPTLAATPAAEVAVAADDAATGGESAAGQTVAQSGGEAQSGDVQPGTADVSATQTTGDAAGTETAAASSGEGTAGGEPETVEQAPLQQSKSSVIIRRGDTLWQISRRIYGKGVRYTTIYLANEDQITDPDRIIPGQVFGVPDEAASDAEAEEVHRKRLHKP
jgi:nucleoid-associated protein YgaU